MARSNFDYSNRPSSGTKLCASIAKDLENKATRKKQDVQKAPGARRRDKSEERQHDDKEHVTDVKKHEVFKLDIKVPGKIVTDEAFAILADGLEKALRACTDLALVDLNVAGNGLTTHSLARLAPIIQRANLDLQTLNLSGNNIQVASDQQAKEWVIFLQSFAQCRSLRRLDLSDNISLGHRALEIFARLYTGERPIDPLPTDGRQSVYSLPDVTIEEDQRLTKVEKQTDLWSDETDMESSMRSDSYGHGLAEAGFLQYKCGLRSLPYLTIHNVGLTDTGAMFLSYILEQHYYPNQLLDRTNAADISTQVRVYSQDARSTGIDWDKNEDTLGKDGIQLLQRAEKVRMSLMADWDNAMSSSITAGYDVIGHPEAQFPIIKSEVSSVHPRRASMRSIYFTDDNSSNLHDLETCRKKCQRNALVKHGLQSFEIWRTAMLILKISRQIMMLVSRDGAYSANKMLRQQFSADHDNGVQPVQEQEQEAHEAPFPRASTDASLHQRFTGLSLRPTYAAKLTASPGVLNEPLLAVTGVPIDLVALSSARLPRVSTTPSKSSLTSSKQPMMAKNQERRNSPQRSKGSIKGGSLRQVYEEWQMRHMERTQAQQGGASDGYRDRSLRCQLPLSVCQKILEKAMCPEELEILSERQLRKVFEWGQLEGSLVTELDWRCKDESSQIWMLLEAVDCLAYE